MGQTKPTILCKSKAAGAFYFLETAARVGGAYIADVVEFASGINPGSSRRGSKSPP
jgi:biotin carboxylase